LFNTVAANGQTACHTAQAQTYFAKEQYEGHQETRTNRSPFGSNV
jgi:hypothetical protein